MKMKGNNVLRSLVRIGALTSVASLVGCATQYVAPQGQPTDRAQIRIEKIDKDVGELVIARVDGQKVSGDTVAILPGQHTLRIKKYPPVGMNWMYGLLGRLSMETDSVSRDLPFTAEKNADYLVRYTEDTGLPPKKLGVVSTSSIKRRFWIEDVKTGRTISEKN